MRGLTVLALVLNSLGAAVGLMLLPGAFLMTNMAAFSLYPLCLAISLLALAPLSFIAEQREPAKKVGRWLTMLPIVTIVSTGAGWMINMFFGAKW